MTNQLPLISVVMATYNGERFLAEQIDSILRQTYPTIEIIAIDDGSTDGTLTMLQEYASRFPQLTVVRNERNLGYVRNFEKGMLLAHGDLIALSDQDDIWLPEKLSTLYEHLGNHEIIYSNSELVDESGLSLHRKMSDIRNQISYDDCLMYTVGAWAPGHAMLFRSSLVQRCLPFPTIVTHDFWLGFVAACKGAIKYLDIPLVKYRQHNANAIGANTQAKRAGSTKTGKAEKQQILRQRMQLLYEKCPAENIQQKKVLHDLHLSYQDHSFKNNWSRMSIFLQYRKKMLAYKKKSDFMQVLFCLKTFFKIV
ncbi:glycosyltransferase family 2 protein [Flavihumibacter fluvii]|uniref:glycosyltransferase family 2 protein n=1 Tax=Flavihumibacter fluvii TaxID=2838157 RepID=UPI001BDEE7F1|nr:glycosyltransferase family 2 protein [Flavihumibacter fluvii]ULQ51461.1 glycosyltransferase family 2 protein [Flavihumibacter fluvii]